MTYHTVTLTRQEIDDAIRVAVAKRFGILRSDVGKLRYKMKWRRTDVFGVAGVTALIDPPL